MSQARNYTLFLITILAMLVSCAGTDHWAKRVEWVDLDSTSLPDQTDFRDESAVILLDEGKMEIFGSEATAFSEFERHKILKIFNRRGEKFANVLIPYYPTITIDKIEARTISPDGKITVIKPENIFDVNLYPNFIFYSDQRAKIFTFPAVEPGSILEYRYRQSIKGRTLWHSWSFQDEIPTLLSRFTVVHPSEWELKYQIYNTDLDPQITQAPIGFKSTHRWEKRNVPALKSEFGMPPRRDLLYRLSLAPVGIKNWDDVAKWYDELSSPQLKANDAVKKLAKELTANCSTNREKLQRIYEWVRDNIRYIAVNIGMGGFQPHSVTEIFLNKYGDCKDMTTLICSMAREVGIPVYSVLISTRQNGQPDTSLASPFQFNHAIAYCPAIEPAEIWMDATEKGCPFGQLPWYDQGVPVLVIEENGSSFIHTTPLDSTHHNQLITEWQVALDDKNMACIEGKMIFTGSPASEKREELFVSSSEEIRDWLDRYLAERFMGVNLDSFSISGLYPVEDPLVISFTFSSSSFVRQISDQMILDPSAIALFELPTYFSSRERAHPIQFKYPFTYHVNLQIDLPPHYSSGTSTHQDSVNSAFGSASWSWQFQERQLKIEIKYNLTQRDVSADQYPNFHSFLRQVQEKNRKEIVFIQR